VRAVADQVAGRVAAAMDGARRRWCHPRWRALCALCALRSRSS
jgi:hypothetical protein